MSWLSKQGFETPFLDFDKHSGIPPGADWERTLYREIDLAEAVIVVHTPNWLASKWCFAEFTQSRALGKPIFPIIQSPTGERWISSDIQVLDLTKDREGGLQSLSTELTQIALNAQGGFHWDPSRPPYPGLRSFTEEDAAIFFGRDDEVRQLIERLNARRAKGGARLVVVLGSSGSGKSSLMRAGVIPRLKRVPGSWIVMTSMRPQTHPIDQLAVALATATDDARHWRTMRDRLLAEDPVQLMSEVAHDIRALQGNTTAHILLPVDQAEELFTMAEKVQADRFLAVLSEALKADIPLLPLLTMRSDHLGDLQSASALTVRLDEISLGPMPLARIPQIIEGPARVAGLGIEEEFVHQAARDAETEDALPLLAFALSELYDKASRDNYLGLEEYLSLGDNRLGLSPLENAVRRRAEDVIDEAQPTENELTALRDAFVPAMVRVNDEGQYVRQPAQWSALPPKSHLLLEKLAAARLLVLRKDVDERVVEVAHEALLRNWPLLRGWLDEARDFLRGRQQMGIYLRDWKAAPESEKDAALLSGLRLSRAEVWLHERRDQLSAEERGLIEASIAKRDAEAAKKLRVRKRIRQGVAAAFVTTFGLMLLAGGQWAIAESQQRIARSNAEKLDMSVREMLESLSIDQALGTTDGVVLGNIETHSEDWFELLEGRTVGWVDASTGRSDVTPFIAARTFGNGRVIAAGHDGIVVLCDNYTYDCDETRSTRVQAFFLNMLTSWLAYGSLSQDRSVFDSLFGEESIETIDVAIATGHCQITPDMVPEVGEALVTTLSSFAGHKVHILDVPLTAEKLEGMDVLIVGNAWGNIAPEEIAAVRGFVENGGGLLAAGLGWSWRDHSNEPFGFQACPDRSKMRGQNVADLSTYPMNRLLQPFQAQFGIGSIFP